MVTIWCILVFYILKLVTSETALEIEVTNQLNILQEEVYFPINVYLSGLSTRLESLVTNFSNYQLEAEDVINSYTLSINDDIDAILQTFQELQIDKNDCQEHHNDNFRQIMKTTSEDLKFLVLDGISDAQRIISDARNVFMVVQNKTVAISLAVQSCMTGMNNSECLFEALETILIMQRIFPKIIHTVGSQHEVQLLLLEDDFIAGLEKIAVRVFDSYVGLLDDFLICTMKWRV